MLKRPSSPGASGLEHDHGDVNACGNTTLQPNVGAPPTGYRSASDLVFYQGRLKQELARVAAEQDEAVRALHWRWAQLYRAKIRQLRRTAGAWPVPDQTNTLA